MPKFSAYMKGGEGIVGPPGASFISGIVATTSQLPENPPENRQIYLVGESDPKHIYAYVDGVWTDQGLTASEVANANATIQSIGWTEDPTVQVSFSTENQKDYFNFDFAVPKTRPAGFGTSSDASATTIAFGATPTVSVSISGEDWEKNFHFDFNIPAGEPAGFGTPHVEVEKVPSGTDPVVEISTVTTSPENAKEFNFHFGIPEGVAAGFSTNQNVSVSTLDAGEQATVEISTVTTSPETEKVFNFHFGLPRGDALAIYDGIPFTANADGYNYHWEDRNGTSTLIFDRGTVEKVPIYIYNNNNESIAFTFKLSTTTIEYEADEKFDGTMYLMMPATLQSVEVGSVSSTTYDNQPVISRSTGSTTTTLILDFVIPEGYPGRNSIDSITTNIESISTKVNNNIINIESLSTNKVNKAGDTMTGILTISASSPNEALLKVSNDSVTIGTAPSSDIWIGGLNFRDSADKTLGYIESFYTTTKKSSVRLLAKNWNGNTSYNNYIDLGITYDNSASVEVSHPAAWCTGIGAVNKAGDAMTGNLNFKSSTINASAADNGVSGVNYPTTFNITDTADRIIVRQEAVVNPNGNIGSFWYVRNYNTLGTLVASKGMSMTMNKSGALTWTVDNAANFRSAISAVCTAGDNLTGTLTSKPSSGVSYIAGCGGNGAGIYVKKGTLNSSQWIPGITIQTKTGGGWAIGNYDDENLQFVYGTKANIDAGNNTTVVYTLNSSGYFSGYSNRHRALLWTNSNGYWNASRITLSSSSYNYLIVEWTPYADADAPIICQTFKKGRDILLYFNSIQAGNTTNTFIMSRLLNYVSATAYDAGLGNIARWGGGVESTGQNYFMIPLNIYGIW